MTPAAITVLIPTHGRPQDLSRCLAALAKQTRSPASVVLVMRPDDAASAETARAYSDRVPVRVAIVERTGQVQALNRGLSVIDSPLVAITDDDASPRADWLQRIVEHFDDPTVGAVGGRDIVHSGGAVQDGYASVVGRVRWYGRMVGNHHLEGPTQEVSFLKGANMSYRRHLLPALDENLAGAGAQVCNDMQASLRVSRLGWRVVWDPSVTVDHYPAPRTDHGDRLGLTADATVHMIHNQVYIVLSLLGGWRRITAFAYAVLVGTREDPGLLRIPISLASSRSPRRALSGSLARWKGCASGVRTYLRTVSSGEATF